MADAQQFFGQILPEAINRTFETLESRAQSARDANAPDAEALAAAWKGLQSVSATMLFEILDDEPLRFYVNQHQGRVTVGPEPGSDPVVVLSQSLADFDALQAAGATPLLGGGGGGDKRGRAPVFKPAFIDQVAALNKIMQIVIEEVPDRGETTTVLRLGRRIQHTEPDVTLRLTLDTYQQMVAGTIPPPVAFMQGLLRVDGDMSLLMQLAQHAMGSR